MHGTGRGQYRLCYAQATAVMMCMGELAMDWQKANVSVMDQIPDRSVCSCLRMAATAPAHPADRQACVRPGAQPTHVGCMHVGCMWACRCTTQASSASRCACMGHLPLARGVEVCHEVHGAAVIGDVAVGGVKVVHQLHNRQLLGACHAVKVWRRCGEGLTGRCMHTVQGRA